MRGRSVVRASLKAGMANGAGQSLVEALVGMVALAGLFILIPVLGRYQDLGLQSMHAASGVAFATARNAPDPASAAAHPFQQATRRWTDRRGHAMLTLDESGIGAAVGLSGSSNEGWQLGGQHSAARALRQEWALDGGLLTARVRVSPAAGTGASPPGPARLGVGAGLPGGDSASGAGTLWTGLVAPPVHRRLAILPGAGHAGSDAAAQSRMASSGLAWSTNARQSVSAGRAAAAVLQPLDAGWNRPAPDFDWLSAWSGLVPSSALEAP
jgi:hypothetical protein